jgi:hypothetical protein
MRYRILVRPVRPAAQAAGRLRAFHPHGTDRPPAHATPGRAGAHRLSPAGTRDRAGAGRAARWRATGR